MFARGNTPIALGSGGLVTVIALLALSSCHAPTDRLDASQRFRGPIPSRNQHPIALTLPAFRPRRAVTQPRGSWGFAVDSAYSSIFQNSASGPERVLLDGEIWTNAARVRYGLGERTDIELELPVIATSGGFLDGFVEEWHGFFGFPNGNRESRPDDAFAMQLSYAGESVYTLEEDHIGLGDVPLIVTHTLAPESESWPGVALRVGAQFPTGSTDDGTSNGELDLGIGLVFERSWRRVDVTGGIDYSYVGGYESFENTPVDVDDLWGWQLGAEYLWNRHLSVLAQLVYTSSLVEGYALDQIDGEVLDLGFGAAVDTGSQSRLVATFHEDLVSDSGTDFAVALSWIWGM